MLHICVGKGHLDIVLDLLRGGRFDINNTHSQNCTPLHVATKNKLNNMAYALILIGADGNIKDRDGNLPEFRYSAQHQGDVNNFLRFRGTARTNPILLRITVQLRDIKIIEILLQRRSLCIDTPDLFGQTALYLTAYREPVSMNSSKIPLSDGVAADIAKMLLSKGSNVNIQTFKGVTTLHAAIENEYFKLVDTLLEHDADVNVKTDINETPLHVSVRKNFDAISQKLLNKGANANVKLTYYQITPLHIAVYKRNEKIAELLLQFGAQLDCKTKFDLTPLHIATIVGSLKIVKLFLKLGVDMNATDEFGRTALHIACKKRYGGIVTALLNHGADINIINSDNYTLFDYAASGVFYSEAKMYDPEGDLCTLENTNKILKYHVIKMRALNLFVTEKIFKFMDGNVELRNFRNKCETEVLNLKREMINDFVSFYDFLTKNKLATSVIYEDIIPVLSLGEYKIKFPIYADMLEINLMKRKRRNMLLNQINHPSPNIFGLPYCCLKNILSYLNESALMILVRAIKPVKDEEISLSIFERTKNQDDIREIAKNMSKSIDYFTRIKRTLSLERFVRRQDPIYLSEVSLMFAYLERICLDKCYCRDRKCSTLYHNTLYTYTF